jgi:hypothetical protein
MFNFFKKKSKIEVLQVKYEKLLEESFLLSKTNRSESDKKFVEAQSIMSEIENHKL